MRLSFTPHADTTAVLTISSGKPHEVIGTFLEQVNLQHGPLDLEQLIEVMQGITDALTQCSQEGVGIGRGRRAQFGPTDEDFTITVDVQSEFPELAAR